MQDTCANAAPKVWSWSRRSKLAKAAKFLLTVGSVGAIRSKTLTAFPEAEYREIIAALP